MTEEIDVKKLTATVEAGAETGTWVVSVFDRDTEENFTLNITADTEMDAAFKAMEQVNGSD